MSGGERVDRERWLLFEVQVWVSCFIGGFIAFAVGTASGFLGIALGAAGIAANLDSFGVSQTILAVIVGLFLTSIVGSRLWGLSVGVFATFAPLAERIFKFAQWDGDGAIELAHEFHPWIFLGSAMFGLPSLTTLVLYSWTCQAASPHGGPTHAVCAGFEPGLFREVLLVFVRLFLSGYGVGGALLLVALVMELRFGWRDSAAQERYQNSFLYGWLHPMDDVRRFFNSRGDETDSSD